MYTALLIIAIVLSFILIFFLGVNQMALKDSIANLQAIANTLSTSSQNLIALAGQLKLNAVDPADVAAIDAIVAQLTSINTNLVNATQ